MRIATYLKLICNVMISAIQLDFLWYCHKPRANKKLKSWNQLAVVNLCYSSRLSVRWIFILIQGIPRKIGPCTFRPYFTLSLVLQKTSNIIVCRNWTFFLLWFMIAFVYESQGIQSLWCMCFSLSISSFPLFMTLFSCIQEWAGHSRFIRVMPNTPAAVGMAASGTNFLTRLWK